MNTTPQADPRYVPNLIGIAGKAGTGKTSLALYLERTRGFERVGFADALKGGLGAMFGLSGEQLYGELKGVADPLWGMTPREMLQRVGTDLMREQFDGDVWVKALSARLAGMQGRPVVVDDVRFPNEADFIARRGLLVQVKRPAADIDVGAIDEQHESETALDDYAGFGFTVDNDADFAELYGRFEGRLARFTDRARQQVEGRRRSGVIVPG